MKPDDSPAAPPRLAQDLQGAGRLAVDAVTGVTRVVEAMHRTIAGRSAPLGPAPTGPASGVAGLVYRSVHGIARGVGWGLDTTLSALEPLLGNTPGGARREAVVAALNGVLGDHLAATANPLAIPMRLRRDGVALTLERGALARELPEAGPKVLVLLHGLCMNDLQWHHAGHHHGEALARRGGFTVLHLHYNTGLPVWRNGQVLDDTLQRLLQAWPVPLERLVLLGHSMGGLVARSACHSARATGHTWPRLLSDLVFLGTPHHGAPLERAGHAAHGLAGLSPYALPFTRLAGLRSAGIQDLRHGHVLAPASGEAGEGARLPAPLPEGVACFAVAATRRPSTGGARARLPGDGLVPVDSALGRHDDPAFDLGLPAAHQRVLPGLNHFDLLGSAEVTRQLERWLLRRGG